VPYGNYLLDMDGVLVTGRTAIPGAGDFLLRLEAAGRPYLVLTNNSSFTPGDLSHRLRAMGIDLPAERLYTSAMATARFLQSQQSAAKAFVVGESGLTTALHEIGYVITDIDPDFVVLGESRMDTDALTTAVRLVAGGARFVATNPDAAGPSERGIVPAAGAVAALVETATGVGPYVVGKPNPFMFRSALDHLGVHSKGTVMVGDNLATDIRGGMEAGMDTILVLSGVTEAVAVARSPYRPTRIVSSVAEIEV
jgi:NagD protein